MNSVTENFKKIHEWLEKNAGKILHESLNASAEQEVIDDFESSLKMSLPLDFKELYKQHNGLNEESNLGSLFYGMSFYSIQDMISDRKSRTSISPLKKCSIEINPQNINNPNWLCLAFDGSHVSIRLDLAANSNGKFGQVILVDDEYQVAFVIAKSISEFVEKFTNDLTSGKYTLDEDALEDGNQFLTPDDSIDLINWHKMKEWQDFLKESPKEVVADTEPSIDLENYKWVKKPYLEIPGAVSMTDNDLLMIYNFESRKYGLINREGESVVPVESHIPLNKKGTYVTKGEKQCSIVGENGEVIFSIEAHNVQEISHLYLFETFGGSILVNKEGKQIKKVHTTERVVTEGTIGVSIVQEDMNTLHGFIDEEGKTVVDFKYRMVTPFSEGLAAVQREDYKWEYIDKSGNTVFALPDNWIRASQFQDGYAMVHYRDNEKSGFMFINRNFQVVSKDYYGSYSGTHNALFVVSKDGFTGGIDKEGNTVIPFEYSEIRSCSKHLFAVKKRNFKNHFEDKDKLWAYENVFYTSGILDLSGAVVIDCKFDYLAYANDDIFIVRKGKYAGYINRKEEVVLPIAFDNVGVIKNGEALVKYKGKYGIIKIG